MSFRKTFLVALTTLFVIPLVIFMGHAIELGGNLGAWAGLLLGSIYGACALGVCWLLLGHWERRLLNRVGEDELDEATGFSTSVATEQESLSWTTDIPIERELVEALDPVDPAEAHWVEEPQVRIDGEVHTSAEATALLRGCIAKAEDLPSLSGGSDRFRALNFDNYAIDMRRLFDALRHESSSAAIVLYSRDERRLVFANEAVRRLFGWDPDRFAQRFPGLIIGAQAAWEDAVLSLDPQDEAAIRLVIQTKHRDHAITQSVWGLITAGSFRGIVVGVLYQ